jgi:adenylate kinase family enzyme
MIPSRLSGPPWPSFLLIGPTGSGKSPLGAELERRGWRGRRSVHFDFGAVLRAIATDPAAGEGLPEAGVAAIRSSLATGALFADRDLPMIVRIVKRFAARAALGPADLLVLNGLPRHEGQAAGLAGILAVERVILLEAAAEVVRERLRRDPGGDRSGRTDDSAAAVRRRLADFRERTRPLADFYRRRGVPLTSITVTAAMTAAEMYEILAKEVAA